MRNYFTFNGVDSRNYGLYISGSGRLHVPEPVWNFAEVPGRSGDLLLGRDRVANELLSYPAFIARATINNTPLSYAEIFGRMRSWLLSVRGYAQLTDSYDPTHYRLACFTGPVDPESAVMLDAGSFELMFNCKPQRYLVSDTDTITLAAGASTTVSKPGFFYAEPLIEVTGAGSFTIGDQAVTVAASSLADPITIDCRLLNCYDDDGVNANRFVSFSDYEFPKIADGTAIDAGDVALKITPRWFEL